MVSNYFYFILLRGKDPIFICFRWVETTNKENQVSLVSFFFEGEDVLHESCLVSFWRKLMIAGARQAFGVAWKLKEGPKKALV